MPDPPDVQSAPGPATNSGEGARRQNAPRRTQDGSRSQGRGGSGPAGEGPGPRPRPEGAGRPPGPRAPRPRDGHAGEPSRAEGSAPPAGSSSGRQGGRRGNKGGEVTQDGSAPGGSHRSRRPYNRGKQTGAADSRPPSGTSTPASRSATLEGEPPAGTPARPKRPRRGRNFNGQLTEGDTRPETPQSEKVSTGQKYKSPAQKADDLTSRLIAELSTSPYPDCLICFAPITPMQPTWSCSPSNPSTVAIEDDSEDPEKPRRTDTSAQCCWMTFHLKCIRQWAQKNVKDVVEAWRARGEERQGDWRCPGCQSKRTAIPSSYW